ncbi:MAG: dockerin type I domain-containing protein [Planctomycetota bacterium]
MKIFRSGRAAALSLSLTGGWVAHAEPLSLYLVGNSITDAVRAGDLVGVADFGGQDLTYGQHLIWGASIDWLWKNPDQASKLSSSGQQFGSAFGKWEQALPAHAWDVVSLQPFQRPMVADVGGEAGDLLHALNFIDHTLQNPANRDARFLLYQDPPSKPDDGRAVSFEDWWVHRDYTGAWDQTWDTSAYTYLLRDAIQAELDARPEAQRPTQPLEVVPVGDVFLGLDVLMRGGGLDGFEAGSEVWDLYTDDVHFNGTGQYAAAMTYYAVLFGESPVGLPVGRYTITQERAAQVQAVVWAVVNGRKIEPGDANLDGEVNQSDLNTLLNNWGQEGTAWAGGDFDGDGVVNQSDLNAVLNLWGTALAPDFLGFSIPEPTAGTATAALLMLGRRPWR